MSPTALKKKVKHTSIHEAVKAGDVEQLEEMVKSGSSMNEMDPVFRFTPLHWAAHLGSLEVRQRLGWNQVIALGWRGGTRTPSPPIPRRGSCMSMYATERLLVFGGKATIS